MSIGFVFSILQKSYVCQPIAKFDKISLKPTSFDIFLIYHHNSPCQGVLPRQNTNQYVMKAWCLKRWCVSQGTLSQLHLHFTMWFGICKATSWFRKQMTHKTLQKQESFELFSSVKPNSPWNKWNHKCAEAPSKLPHRWFSPRFWLWNGVKVHSQQ